MSIWPYVNCLCFSVFLYLTFFVYFKNPKNILNKLCAAICICFSVWNFYYIFMSNPLISKETAVLLEKVFSFSWIGFSSIFLCFTLIYTKKIKTLSFAKFFFITILPAAIFIYQQSNMMIAKDFVKTYYGWGVVWADKSVWYYLYSIYYAAMMLAALTLILVFAIRTKRRDEKKMGMILFYTAILPASLGTVSNLLLPSLGIRAIPELADSLSIVWGLGLVYVVIKYKFMVLTPAMAADDIISTMAESLLLISPESMIISANPYTERLLGYSQEELKDKPINMIFSDDGEKLFAGKDIKKMISKGAVKDVRLEYKTKSGDKVPVSFSGSVMKNKEGGLAGIVGIARDMRQIDSLVKKQKELAEASIVTRTEQAKAKELAKAYDDLKSAQAMLVQSEKVRAMGQLGAGVAHELNSPLAGMLCLMRSYAEKKDKKSLEYKELNEMISGCEYMAKIIKDLSDYTKEGLEEKTELKLEEIIEDTLILVEPQFKTKKMKIEKKYCADLPLIKGEKRKLQQVVMNFMMNAKEAMAEGGVMTVHTKKSEKNEEVYAEIIFQDTGCGIEEAVKEKIFDHFFTTKKTGQGVGLGLAIVKSIINEHNGDILVESELGKGTVFTVRFPAVVG